MQHVTLPQHRSLRALSIAGATLGIGLVAWCAITYAVILGLPPHPANPVLGSSDSDRTALLLVGASLVLMYAAINIMVTRRRANATSRDIAQREATELPLQEQNERYRLLADRSSDMIVVVDRQFVLRYVSQSSRMLVGYEPEELIGNLVDLILHPDDVANVMATLRQLFEGERDHDRIAYRLRHREGHWIWAESLRKVIKYSDAGVPLEIGAALRDITQHVAAETARSESEERLRLLLQSNVTEALYLLDADGNIQSWNASAERTKGYKPAEIIGQNFSIFFTPEDIANGEPARVLANAGKSGHFTTEAWRVRKDGTRFLARVGIDAIRRDDGTLRGFVKVTQDITSQRLEEEQRDRLARDLATARDQAESASRAKSRFLAVITHELRTPLHGILGYAELLTLEGGLNPTQAQRLEVMIAAGQHLLDMISSVLDMSQIEAERLVLLPAELDLSELVRVCLNVIRPTAEAKGLVLAPAPTSHLSIFADPTRLRQVLINLLGNAVKFTPSGLIEVRLRHMEAASRVRLEVADTGPGIWQRHRDKLFQVFERLNAGAVSAIEGAGLGLAIAARLVTLMNGQIGYSDNPGGGSVFWIELPLVAAIPVQKVEADAPSPVHETRRLRVLVADDEALNRGIANGFLSNAGHEVVCVNDGAAAVAAAASGDFDVILMDVRMPNMNGMEATRRIRALPGRRGRVRVVAVTAQAFAEQIELCRQAGMDSHVAKPFKQAALLAALAAVVDAPERPEHAEMPAGAIVEAATVEDDPSPPMFDGTVFEEATDVIPAAEIQEHMRTLIARCEALLDQLRRPGLRSLTEELIDDVHKLAGGAGVFGFLAVAAVAREAEVAATEDTPAAATIINHLADVMEASMKVMRQHLVHLVSQEIQVRDRVSAA